MALRRTDGLVRIGYRVTGLYPNDTWSGKRVTYTRLRCAGGTSLRSCGATRPHHRVSTVQAESR